MAKEKKEERVATPEETAYASKLAAEVLAQAFARCKPDNHCSTAGALYCNFCPPTK